MIYVLSVFLFFVVVLSFLLSFPVRLWLDSALIFRLRWFILKLVYPLEGENSKPRLTLLGRELGPGENKEKKEKKSSKAKKKKKTTKKKKKARKKLTAVAILEILRNKAVSKLLRQVFRFIRRLMASVTISTLIVNLGLDDYYRQGVVMGVLGSVPRTSDFQISGNFNQETDFNIAIRIMPWRILIALIILLFRLPYVGAIRLYLRYR